MKGARCLAIYGPLLIARAPSRRSSGEPGSIISKEADALRYAAKTSGKNAIGTTSDPADMTTAPDTSQMTVRGTCGEPPLECPLTV